MQFFFPPEDNLNADLCKYVMYTISLAYRSSMPWPWHAISQAWMQWMSWLNVINVRGRKIRALGMYVSLFKESKRPQLSLYYLLQGLKFKWMQQQNFFILYYFCWWAIYLDRIDKWNWSPEPPIFFYLMHLKKY